MNDLSKRIAALSPEQQALLKRRISQKQVQQPQPWTIPKRDSSKQNNLVVSFEQQGMWFQHQLGTTSAVSNNVSISLKITGKLDVDALEQSIREIIQRHEILRTNYQTTTGELTQIIIPLRNWTLRMIDLQTYQIPERERELNRIASVQACQPFDLETDLLLLRTTLVQCDACEFVLILTIHHIAMDAWSLGIFFRELNVLYAAFSTGKPSPLEPLPIQYADFAVWQQQHLQGKALENDLNYWKRQLTNSPDLLSLTSDRPRPSVQSFKGKTLSFLIPKTLTASLKSLSEQNEATLFMMLLAALQTLLFRYTGQNDIVVGSPIANRHQPEIENLIGCFINTLVLRTDLSGNPSFRNLLKRVRETVLGALAHQRLPFEKLIVEFELGQSLTYAPLFQVMLILQNAFSTKSIELSGLKVAYERIDNQTSDLDLTIHLVEGDMGLIGKLEYNTDLFDESRMNRMLGHFQTLLAAIVENPDCTIAALPLLTLTEQEQLATWNQTSSIDLAKILELAGRELPIGNSIRKLNTYILDPCLQPTPIGIAGELYIGDRDTAIYKTGDRALYSSDGTIQFLGRIEHQIKIHGFYIQLEDIEAILMQHPQIQETVVIEQIDRAELADDQQLIAYIVPILGYTLNSRNLRRFLEKRLPKYMIPSEFILLKSLPIDADGKVNRHSLSLAESISLDSAADFIAPRTTSERKIAQIFMEVLEINQVSVDDDFFELGGHFLLGNKLVTRLLIVFQVKITIVDLFQSPTVAELAERIEQLQNLTATSLNLELLQI
ncbi:condensation domain-containing protein [Pseudanabaena sp. ABRG5-3]|uniref:condensation domain-containing protein n=1 Tax=Pseudanabaena sp. ABRG5-3 TaxID=685565 RepID=UPI000DC6E037|nr:condensation domain-containing protein [Pseudanabaena sp. ABRG5-3]BBC27134.1 amino acid adenylation domain protein [Pseudanabaena sp. ABRG5-3]